MLKYKNLSGNSGVSYYEIGDSYIDVDFNGATYRYSYNSAGQEHVEHMKSLAQKGKGLSGYISKYVRMGYE